MSALSPTLQSFFTDRLIAQRHCSPQTIASYRDTMRLLVNYANAATGLRPCELDLADINAELITAFLDYLEHDRHNTIGTRNARLAAIRSLFHYASLRHPEHAADISRVLAIPTKRHDRTTVTHLTKPEIAALLAAPDTTTWIGRRDKTLIHVAIQTGLRVSEFTALTRTDTHLGTAPHLACHGKGRKTRITPIDKPTTRLLHEWLRERGGGPSDPVFPTSRGLPLTRDAVARRLAIHAATAAADCPTLRAKTITPHVLRHYVDGWVMWPAGVFPLLGLSLSPVLAT